MNPLKIATWSEVPDREPVGALVEQRRPGDRAVRRQPFGALRPLPAPRRADGRRPRRRRQPDLRPARLGLRVPHRRVELRQRRAADEVLLVGRGRRPAGRRSTRSRHGRRSIRSPTTATPTRASYQDPHGDPAEPHVGLIRRLADEGLDYLGHHGPVTSMGVAPRPSCPSGTTSSSSPPSSPASRSSTTSPVGTDVVIGPNADKPLRLDIPMFVSDMSFGALSEEAKVALARGAELAGHRHLLGRGRHAARGAGRELPLLLRAGQREVRLVARQGRATCRPSTSSSARAPRPAPAATCPASRSTARSPRSAASSRARMRSRRRPSPTSHCEDDFRRARRRGPRGVGGHSDRRQAVGPAHRGRHRRRPAHRRRLHHPRRSWRRHRRRPGRCSATTSRCRRSRRWPGPAATSTPAVGATSPWSSPGACGPTPTSPRRSPWAPTRSPSRNSAMQAIGCLGHAGLLDQQLPGRHRHPEDRSLRARLLVDEAAAAAAPVLRAPRSS